MRRFSLLVSLVFVTIIFPAAMDSMVQAQANQPTGAASQSSGYPGAGYLIGKGDVLEVNVWREPMLSGEAVVRNDGMISLALAGDVEAAGHTTADLKEEIQRRLKQYLGEPVVTVMVRTAASQKFYVVGEVRTPGEFDLVKEMTVVQAIARAGGFTDWADKGKIILLRKEGGTEILIPINYKDIVKGKGIGQNQLLRANDTIIVP
jgi:polysaccharide biosynthesis/export protein